MPRADQIIDSLKDGLSDAILNVDYPQENRILIDVKKESIREASKKVMEIGGRYQVSTGYDNIERDGTLGLIHSFVFDKDNVFINIRTFVPQDDPVLESITPDIPNAGWSEREYQDLLGFRFEGHPKPKRLILADDFPDGIYPLRKEIPWNLMPPAAEDVAYQLDDVPRRLFGSPDRAVSSHPP